LNYSEAVDYIRNIERAGSDYGIERMRYLLDLLGAPDKCGKFVHVAGTNGKGSVCAYISSILRESGYKVGTYNSPSVFCYNERWLFDGKPLSDEDVARYMTEVRECIESENKRRKDAESLIDFQKRKTDGDMGLVPKNAVKRDISLENEAENAHIIGYSERVLNGKFSPTAFEIETAVAMLAFKDKGADIAVLETGLGGRWDATNAIKEKELAVITPIGFDHCALLGNTLSEIASEKAAIIKDDVVTCRQSDEIMREIEKPFLIENGERRYIPARVHISSEAKPISASVKGQCFEYEGKTYGIKLLGAHQLVNASIAIIATRILREKGWNIPEEALEDGLKKAEWHARLEIVENAEKYGLTVQKGKSLVFDGAHNPHGASALKDALSTLFADKKIHLVLGILKDKDVDGIIRLLAPIASRITAVTPPSPRALSADKLAEKIERFISLKDTNENRSAALELGACEKKADNSAPDSTRFCQCSDNIKSALKDALDGDCEVVVLCGSLTLFSALVKK